MMEVKASALGSSDGVSESLTLALGSWGGNGVKGALLVIPHWLQIAVTFSSALSISYLRDE